LVGVVAERTGFHTHARNVSCGKWYRYRLRTDGADDPRAWTIPVPERLDMMKRLAAGLVGEHDFSAYCYKAASPNRVKNISRVQLTEDAAGITIDIEGDSFLRHMVRKMVSTLVAVGSGDFDCELALMLLSEGRSRGTPRAAPAHGLTLMAIRQKPD